MANLISRFSFVDQYLKIWSVISFEVASSSAMNVSNVLALIIYSVSIPASSKSAFDVFNASAVKSASI